MDHELSEWMGDIVHFPTPMHMRNLARVLKVHLETHLATFDAAKAQPLIDWLKTVIDNTTMTADQLEETKRSLIDRFGDLIDLIKPGILHILMMVASAIPCELRPRKH